MKILYSTLRRQKKGSGGQAIGLMEAFIEYQGLYLAPLLGPTQMGHSAAVSGGGQI